MSGKDDSFAAVEKRIRFRTISNSLQNDSKIEELFPEAKSKTDERTTDVIEIKKKEYQASLFSFLNIELTRGYLLENDEEQFTARREKVYSFMKIPREVEKFMTYGFLQCADAFLYVYTFLPMRFLLALWRLVIRTFDNCFGKIKPPEASRSFLKPAEICDLLKAFIIIICSVFMFYLDTNMLYHMVKSQSVIKLYIFYNMLEVGDRLFSAFGQDIIDALFWTATEPKDRRREHAGVLPHMVFAVTYVFLHSVLVLFQATTLNVAINSNNKALLTIMISNNFVELKGSVFKKFDKNNLFQVACSDVRERFHLFVLLFIVVLQTMREYSWREEQFWVLLPDCLLVLFAEILVDWIKHAFITRFNELPVDVYRDYTTSLAYDMAQTRQKNAFSDHSDLVARRMGFIPIPLGVVMVRVLAHALYIEGPASMTLLFVGYLNVASVRVLNSIIILGTACYLITQHKHDKGNCQTSPSSVRANSPVSSPNGKVPLILARDPIVTSSPIKPVPSTRSQSTEVPSRTDDKSTNYLPDCSLGATAIFSNSAVDLKDVCLNEELLRVTEINQVSSEDGDDEENLSKSVPNIQQELNENKSEGANMDMVQKLSESNLKKRSDSEPTIVPPADENKTDL